MATLIDKIKNPFVPGFKEHWSFTNGLEASLWKGQECTLVIYRFKKDVSDQIFKLLTQNDRFIDLKLLVGAHYEIEINPELQTDIFAFLESIDVSSLKEGNSY